MYMIFRVICLDKQFIYFSIHWSFNTFPYNCHLVHSPKLQFKKFLTKIVWKQVGRAYMLLSKPNWLSAVSVMCSKNSTFYSNSELAFNMKSDKLWWNLDCRSRFGNVTHYLTPTKRGSMTTISYVVWWVVYR